MKVERARWVSKGVRESSIGFEYRNYDNIQLL